MDKKVKDLLNEQIMKELYSAYLYLEMANYYADVGLDGFENWFYIQAQEEQSHAMLIREYLHYNDESVTLLPIEAPQEKFESYDAPLHAALAHEKLVTDLIHNIYSAAADVKDYRTMEFLNWFVKEQAEEEKNVNDLIAKYELFAKDGEGLYSLDKELQARTYEPPTFSFD